MKATHDLAVASDPSTTQFGRYRLLESIGQGGMANVMVAVMPGPGRFNKLLVLKTICEQIRSDNDQYATMFLDEARLAARLSHPNVVHTYEVGQERGVYYIAMEYLEGQSLSDVQKLGPGSLPLEARLRILIETAHGLHHAHELTDYSGSSLHVVHRDVSPQNIFLTYDGQVKLLDFGIAKMRDAETVTLAGQMKGKLDYMAPEQLKGDPIDRTADVFALGAILWELLAGRPMSGGRDVSQITRVHNRLTKKEPSIRKAMPELDAGLAGICDKAVAHEMSERHPSALEFARDLEQYLAERSLVPTAEQLARIIQPAFADARAERRQRVDAALTKVEREPGGSTHSAVFDSGARLAMPAHYGVDNENSGRFGSSTQVETRVSEIVPAPKPMGRRRWLKVATIAMVVAASAWLQLKSTPKAAPKRAQVAAESARQAPIPSALAASSRVAPAAAPTSVHDTVKLTVTSTTPGVHVTLDGAVIPQLPFEAEVAADHAIHKLVASAPGCETMTQVLTLDRHRQVAINPPMVRKDSDAARISRKHASVESQTVKKSARPGASEEVETPSPGEEMDSKLRGGMGEMSDEDPYR